MSFVIGMCYKNFAVIAADKRVTDNGVAIEENYIKIEQISNNNKIYVGCGGNKDFTKKVVDTLKSISPTHLSSIENCVALLKEISNTIITTNNFNRNEISGKFILISKIRQVGSSDNLFKLMSFDSSTNEIQYCDSSTENLYYLYASSDHINVPIIEKIIENNLINYNICVEAISKIIEDISKLDPTVNNNLTIVDLSDYR